MIILCLADSTMTNSPMYISKGKRVLLHSLYFLLSAIYCNAQQTPSSVMHITFTDVRSDVGQIIVAVYDSEKQWAYDPRYTYKYGKNDIDKGAVKVKIPSLPYGRYAISVMDDEDMDNEMKYFMKLPREGFGMSGNPSYLSLKLPAYELCSFELDSPEVYFSIKMNYLNKRKKVK